MVDTNVLNIIHINGKEFKLLYHDPSTIGKTFSLVIPCDLADVSEVASTFENFDEFTIYEYDNTTLVKTVCTYNTYTGNVDFLKNTYTDTEGNAISAIRLVLKETDYETLVKKLNDQINPSIDYDSMTEVQYREVCINNFNEACTEVIYAGVDVETEFGTEHFSATDEDQRNIKDIFDIAIMSGKGFAYHADGTPCKIYSYEDIIKIYMAIKSLVLYQTTYCNALNTYARKLVYKNQMAALEYGQEIPDEEIAKEMNASLEFGKSIIEALASVYLKDDEASNEDVIEDKEPVKSEADGESNEDAEVVD